MEGETLRASSGTGSDEEPFRLLAVKLSSTTCPGVVVVATSLDETGRSVRQLAVLLGLAGPVALLVAGLGGWWLARRALAPVTAMTREAETIGIERLDERIEVPPSADELQHLAVTLNAMLDRLERGVEDKRRFAADASHELRTPLAVMRSELDVSLRDPDLTPSARSALESAEEEVERMREIVENLLTLARADDGTLDLLRAPEDLRAIASAVVGATSPLARVAGVRLEIQGPAARCSVDRARIEQVLTNLVNNAVRFSPDRGLVEIECWIRAGEVGCTVTDQGPGVPPEMGARIFERFVRADPTRASDGGSGLGLAISREIVEAHGGRIWLDSRPGSGSAFSFAVPDPGPQTRA
jgi:heavy metal sensor kinase